MKIIKFEAENIKKLRVVEIAPQGNIVEITGANGAGKSSILDAIRYAMEGADSIPSVPLRKGAAKGHVTLNLGELIVTRKFGAGGSTELRVESQDGTRLKSPQQILDRLYGTLTFDPLEFSRMRPEAQLEQLRKLVKLEVDIDDLDYQNKKAYDERTNLNREARTLNAQADGIIVPATTPDEEVDVSELIHQLEEAGKANAAVETAKAKRELLESSLRNKEREVQILGESALQTIADGERSAKGKRVSAQEVIASAEAEAKRLVERAMAEAERLEREAEESVSAAQGKAKQLKTQADAASSSAQVYRQELSDWSCPALVDTAELNLKIGMSQTVNRQVQLKKQRAKIRAKASEIEAEATKLTRAIERREEQKNEAIANAKMPVPGLGFGEGQVLFNGIPFEQASSAEQLRVSTAIAIAMNPKLRVIRIQDGSLLDENNMTVLAEMAEQNDMQIWVERVTGIGKSAVIIDAGEVISQEAK